MMPLHPNFRKLLLVKIRKLKRSDLDNYDSLLALRLQATHQKSLMEPRSESRAAVEKLITETTRAANRVISPFRQQFDALHLLWAYRRRLALRQGNLLQIPTSWKNLGGLVLAAIDHSGAQFAYFGSLLLRWIKSLFPVRAQKREPETHQPQKNGKIRQ